jgi:hypothetical protein
MSGCYCDFDNAPEFYNSSRPLAKKAHKCDECGRIINRGERYERATGKWDGEVSTAKTCVYCLMARDLIESVALCFCWEHGNLHNNIIGWLDDSNVPPGVAMAIGRIEIDRTKDK